MTDKASLHFYFGMISHPLIGAFTAPQVPQSSGMHRYRHASRLCWGDWGQEHQLDNFAGQRLYARMENRISKNFREPRALLQCRSNLVPEGRHLREIRQTGWCRSDLTDL
jgi:hypothetical protein